MNRYDSYKDSGVEWIGEIPSGWGKSPIKYYYNYKKGSRGQELTKTYIQDNLGDYPVYSGQTENEGVLGRISDFEFDFPEGVIFTTTVGVKMMSTKVLRNKFSLSQNCLIMIPKKEVNSDFVNYFISVDWVFRKLQFPKILQPSLRMEDIDQYFFYYPPLSEQQQIVSFLDTKTTLIDSLIEKTQQKIELLKEKRTTLINKVVTKGLNPNVEMKYSGIEWIGEIPSHWKRTPLKYNSYMKGRIGWKGLKQDEFLDEGNYYLITGHDIKNDKMNWENCYHISKERYEESPEIMLKEEDLLFTKDGTIGKTLYIESLPKPTSLNSHLLVIRPLNRFYSSKFLQYMFKTTQFLMYVEHNKTGTTFYGMSQNSMENFKGYFPPLFEQQQIVKYLDEQTQIIDKTISIEEKRIELLKEYRQSLISEVVTGKRKVVV